MEQSKVYFTSFKATGQENLLQKLHRLMKTAGFEEIDFTDKFAAIKIHFGEYGNLAFLRPNYAKVVADYVKELGGKPFLTDCNTLYVGSRKNALDHLETAYLNGFSPFQTGCHVVQTDQGGNGVLGKGTVEVSGPVYIFCGHNRQISVITGRHFVQNPFHRFSHFSFLQNIFFTNFYK